MDYPTEKKISVLVEFQETVQTEPYLQLHRLQIYQLSKLLGHLF